jgi:Rrf2 family protein
VLQRLTHSNILESYKGPNGGVKLKKNAADITIQDIIKSLDENFTVPECALGLPIFQNHKICPIHSEWAELRNKIEAMIETITIHELAEENQKFHHK